MRLVDVLGIDSNATLPTKTKIETDQVQGCCRRQRNAQTPVRTLRSTEMSTHWSKKERNEPRKGLAFGVGKNERPL